MPATRSARTTRPTARWMPVGFALLLTLTPAARAQSVVAGYELQTWATVTDPVDIAAASDGALYVGRDAAGSGGTSADAVAIHRIAPDGSVTTFGPPIPDPDTVLVDRDGDVASLGAVLTGGISVTPTAGQIFALDTQQGLTVLFGPSVAIVNPSGLAIEASGDLLVTDFNQGKVFRLTNLVPTAIITNASGSPLDIALAPATGNLAVSWADGVIRTYTPAGVLLDGTFGVGRALAYQQSTGDLWTVDNASGQLLRIRPDGTTSVMGSGFTTVWGMDFTDTGDLFLTEFNKDRVLRVRPVPWTDLGHGLAGAFGVPTNVGSGSLAANTPTSLVLANARPNALTGFVMGVNEINLPYKGGVLVPNPSPPGFVVYLFTSPSGGFTVNTVWPPGVPSGFTFAQQWWVQDAAAVHGYAASNALRGTTP